MRREHWSRSPEQRGRKTWAESGDVGEKPSLRIRICPPAGNEEIRSYDSVPEQAKEFWRNLPGGSRKTKLGNLLEFYRKRYLARGGETLSWEEIEDEMDERRNRE